MSLWKDITTDHLTGHYVAKDVFKACAFVVGVGVVVFAATADYLAGREVRQEGAVLLLTYAFGVGVSKAVEGYYSRQTKDGQGNPLAQPGTTEPPADPKLMPQAPADAASS
ncbi:MAG: hypothetical protein ACRYFX_18990 [Janthinobacterium lividum]